MQCTDSEYKSRLGPTDRFGHQHHIITYCWYGTSAHKFDHAKLSALLRSSEHYNELHVQNTKQAFLKSVQEPLLQTACLKPSVLCRRRSHPFATAVEHTWYLQVVCAVLALHWGGDPYKFRLTCSEHSEQFQACTVSLYGTLIMLVMLSKSCLVHFSTHASSLMKGTVKTRLNSLQRRKSMEQ